MAKIGDRHAVANLETSAPSGNHNTEITLPDAIELIRSAFWYYQNAGGKLRSGNSGTEIAAILVLPGCSVCQKCRQIFLFESLANGLCQKCLH